MKARFNLFEILRFSTIAYSFLFICTAHSTEEKSNEEFFDRDDSVSLWKIEIDENSVPYTTLYEDSESEEPSLKVKVGSSRRSPNILSDNEIQAGKVKRQPGIYRQPK